ncbi:hypothetical protein FSP39_001307 [Pinctada imbricata]|uniref:Spondin-like TSP1 domain-containing protein n=1 Tax=Pinctada imbricata TaxID=66713 RepID=A0AA88Y1Z0_PINIB|nr:hypothetical protein FSP39_001307 [Pinctada imbricata]
MILLGNKINRLFFNILFSYFLFVGSQSDDCGTPQDCLVSDWEEFSPCSHSCGDSGVQSRKRTILKEASCSGECNLNITETRECSRQCCPKNCVYSEWTKWFKTGKSSECELPGERWAYARQRQITEVASCGGYCDNHKVERKCGNLLCAKDCAISPWTVWSLCQAPCEQDGIRFRTKIILQEPECGGKECGITEEEEECKSGKCPVDCQLGPWSSWSTCDVACGKSNYTRSRFVQLPEYDGAVCTEEPIESQTQTCENYVNVDCMVGVIGGGQIDTCLVQIPNMSP